MIDKSIYTILKHLSAHSYAVQLGLFLLLFFTGWFTENLVSRGTGKRKWVHAFFNLKFFIVDAVPQALMGLFFIQIIHWNQAHHFGLIYTLPSGSSPALLFIVAFLVLDLGEYVYHVTMHKVNFLWGFHAIHHSDQKVDVSTVFREHPMESIIRNCFALWWVFLSGATFWIFFIHLMAQTFFVLFTHARIRLPKRFNKMAGLIFVTPNIHQVHHHYKQPYTDRNYGDILCIWDRLFGTFGILPYKEIKFGVDYLIDRKEDIDFKRLLIQPFKGFRRRKLDAPSSPNRNKIVF